MLIGAPDPSAWPFIPPLLLLTAGLVFCGLFAAKGSRRWGISSLLLSAGAGVGYAIIPPQSFITTLYLHYRFFFGCDLLQAVQARRISWMLPLYCGAFLTGIFLLLVAACLSVRRRVEPEEGAMGGVRPSSGQ